MQKLCLGRGISRTNFAAAVEVYRIIATELKSHKLAKAQRNRHLPAAPPQKPRAADREGDTPMSGVNRTGTVPRQGGRGGKGGSNSRGRTAGGGQRAEWVSEHTRRERRAKGKCLRCGSAEHFIRECYLRPAQQPVGVRHLDTSELSDEEESGEGNAPPPS